jgi:hypothetical protein
MSWIACLLAGSQTITIGRFWVIPEVNVEGTAPLLETGLAVLAATINQHRLFRSRHWAGHVSQPLFFLQALSRPQAIALECRIRAVANRGLALKPFSIDVAGAPPDFTAFGIHVRKLPIHIENLLALDENVSA